MNIAVVDSGAHLVAFSRMDNALLGAIGVSGSTVENDFMVAQAGVTAL